MSGRIGAVMKTAAERDSDGTLGAASASGYGDCELLVLILGRAIDADARPLAEKLLARFGSYVEILAAPRALLKQVPGMSPPALEELKFAYRAALHAAECKAKPRHKLGSMSALFSYLRLAMAFEPIEQFRILFLDKRNRLIVDELQTLGTVDHAPVYTREVVKRALELGAAALILVHNHPSGDPTPSREDIELTLEISALCKRLRIAVHDHLILGRDGFMSMKASGILGHEGSGRAGRGKSAGATEAAPIHIG